ncbi:yqey-like protein [mine drainage metagenome]|uniref:Yqey-like protein n=1 Tax=mine drainage metagenome TaxID=410659 RepID=A0A1J5PHG7_9ZZZZ
MKELAEQLEATDGIKRKGLVLSYLMRFKQICNHPSQWSGDGAWQAEESGKFGRLRELCETIAARQEKVLVFTQFRETTEPLAAFLAGIFGRPGLVLHGGTPVKQRQESVELYDKGGRAELAAQEREEIAIISAYLPKQMSEADVKAAIAAAISETGASGMKDMGKVIGVLKTKYAGQMDFGKASGLVKSALTG